MTQRRAETHPMHTTASAAATKIDYYCLTVSHEHLDLCPHIALSLSLCADHNRFLTKGISSRGDSKDASMGYIM